MILMWLACLGLLLFGLGLFQGALSDAGAFLQKRFLDLSENENSLFKILLLTKMYALSCGGLVRTQYNAMALLNTRTFSKRYSILLLCLSSVAVWSILLMGLGIWLIHWSTLIGFAVVFYLIYFWFGAGKLLFKMFFGLGLVFLGAQLALRDQSILLSTLAEGEIHFLLADGRFTSQFIWLVTSFVMTLLIGVESWSVFFCILLLSSGSLSLNGAVAFVIGELLAHLFVLRWRSRRLDNVARKIAKDYTLASVFGLVVGFVVCGEIRGVFAWGYGFGSNDIVNKNIQFMILFFALIVCQTLTTMAWGHFAAQKKMDEIGAGPYFSPQWIRQDLLSRGLFDYIQEKLKKRLTQLLDQKNNLSTTEREKIPRGILQNHDGEILNLTHWISSISDQGRENC